MKGLYNIFNQIAKVKVKSVIDPLFKAFMMLVVLGIISGIFKVDPWITKIIFAFAALLLIFGLGYFAFYSKKNPDYLRSEEYQLQKHSVDLLGDKDNTLNPNIKEIKYIASPYSKLSDENKKSDFGE